MTAAPFAAFAAAIQPQSPLRAAIDAAYRRLEPDCLPTLIEAATLPPDRAEATAALATRLVEKLRAQKSGNHVAALIQEYSLSSTEGIALMCLSEALLRIPDPATRDALIRDKITGADWQSLAGNASLFVNAASWGLAIASHLTAPPSDATLTAALNRLAAKLSEPIIRGAIEKAMRLMGDAFVTGQTIEAALARARIMEAKGFTYSYDMLGEAAMTADDAANYAASYEAAIHAIGRSSNRRGIHEGPGISIKLSALHPRYTRAQRPRVMAELLPVLKNLVILAKSYDIGINIDAEEADRLDLSLDLLEALCADPDLAGWHGIGFVVQAYQKRAPFVCDFLIDLARRTNHRLMIRLVKGAYWDAEIKRAQIDGMPDFPVFTRKPHTDICYLACASKLLAAREKIFPQFATHNAQTLASIIIMAGTNFRPGDYEFQCLHGMGEGLYEHVVGPVNLNRPCRIYAPVGGHETLLAYLVRRLLENGANASFVNRLTDPAFTIAELVADPTSVPNIGTPNPNIALPVAMFPDRQNSAGLDLSSETTLRALAPQLAASAEASLHAEPTSASLPLKRDSFFIRNPAWPDDIVGTVQNAEPEDINQALAIAAAATWPATPAAERAKTLNRAADLMQQAMPALLGLIIREAGKILPNAIGEVREAIDFLRYYAAQAVTLPNAAPLGPIACISPWNFPLAIFTGQIAAALAAGNTVLAKPAEQTPLIAAEAVRILHQAGIPKSALQLLPGDGTTGAALVADPRIQAVLFTGSLDAARKIQQTLSLRLSAANKPITLIAETGGINVMIADSSALAQQLVTDVIISAFDSAGQRCSALRILCLQDDIYACTLTMLKGAMATLTIGNPANLDTDIGPVITTEAHTEISQYIETMRANNFKITSGAQRAQNFVTPTIIEIDKISDVTREVFGPVLHVMPYRASALDQLIDAINATFYGLTFGLHSRITGTVTHVTNRISAGNIYINRNIIGAAVGVQPFGGSRLSGTGPKAGGPFLLRRLLNAPPMTPTGFACAGPTGETNLWQRRPRGIIAALGPTARDLDAQRAIITQTGNTAIIDDNWFIHPHLAAVLCNGAPEQIINLNQRLANRPGPIIQIFTPDTDGSYHRDYLMLEISISTNTAAAGGNALLLANA
jgi:RHH-type proline utilization regulon transcriptional repressor/proline dehydrogenase/delta 1-pyrroline-5-carboxylate dehydrogenase